MTHPTAPPEAHQRPTGEAHLRRLPVPVWVGILVSLAAAAVASWAALYGLAAATGWGTLHVLGMHLDTAHLLPASVDVGGVSAGWVWLRGDVTPHARDYARRLTYFAAALSLIGNAVGHLAAKEVVSGEGWAMVVAVGAVPAAMVVALVHLAALCTMPAETPPHAAQPEAVQPEVRAVAPASPDFPTGEAAQENRPTPAPSKRLRAAPQAASPKPTREVVVMDILATATTPDDVPGPTAIRETWGVSKTTADRARADALATLNTTRQEA